ncbi:MAG TPA: hypothetical protein VF747_04215, partial [Blastocatellia bacterium]
TYNNKIKRISPKEKSAETFAGTGEGGLSDGDRATFDEPGGVSVAFGKLYVADTNNHAIRVVDLKTKRVETLQLKGLEKLRPQARSKEFMGDVVELPAQSIEPGDATLTLQLDLPRGYKLNAQAPSALSLASPQKQVVSFASGAEQTFRNPHFPINVPIKVAEGEATIKADFLIYYCESAKESLCYFKEARMSIPVKAKKGTGNGKLTATYKLAQ